MQAFQLSVTGIGSSLEARLSTTGGVTVKEWFPKSLKQAHKDARGFAYQHKAANTPADVISHEESFVL